MTVVANKWFPKRRCKGEPPKPCRSKNVLSAAGCELPPFLAALAATPLNVGSKAAATMQNVRGVLISLLPKENRGSWQFGRLEQLIRIDIYRRGDVFWKRQFVECFADEPAQAHDGFAPEQDMKSKLTLQSF